MATIPNDPSFGSQWYLRNTTAGQFDINVIDAWDDYTGVGIQVAVIDGGFDTDHPDLIANYLPAIDYDYDDGDFLPEPGNADPPYDHHGTPVMGIIGAANNSIGGVGVAWNADLVHYRGFNLVGDALRDGAGVGNGVGNTNGDGNGSDVISMSFGRGSNVFTYNNTSVAGAEAASNGGRGGLGTVLVKSSGNDRDPGGSSDREEGTVEALDSTRFTLNVAALRQDGWVTDFSTPGANVAISAFADNTNNQGAIFSTDIVGSDGYRSGSYHNGFGGTSAATPQVAGVVALMLDANGDLGWRDVHEILALTARHVGSNVGSSANFGGPTNGRFEQATQTNGSSWFWNDATNWNGGAMHFSNDYGYGLVDAKAAVRLAETWTGPAKTSANDVSSFEDMLNSNTLLGSGFSTFSRNEVTNIEVEHVSLQINFTQLDDMADLEIFLISPDGTRVQMVADTGDTASFTGRWDFGTVAFRGTQSAGTWQVQIRDDDGSSAGSGQIRIDDIDLRTYGASVSSNDTYYFTNEYSRWDGIAGHGTSFAGGSGTDTINAAAVDQSGSTLNFNSGTGTIDGVSITMSSIERAYTGDGADTIRSGSGLQFVSTGRGNDTFFYTVPRTSGIEWEAGRGVDDTLDWTAFSGDYEVDLETGEFSVVNGALSLEFSGVENLRGGAGDDILRHERFVVNDIRGGDGNDTVEMLLRGFDASDLFDGQDGVDTFDFNQFVSDYTFDLRGDGFSNVSFSTFSSATVRNFERFIAGSGDDTFEMSVASVGGSNAVSIDAGAGDDTFVSLNDGVDLDGGAGTDLLDIGIAAVPVTVNLSTGAVQFGSNAATVANVENVTTGANADTVVITSAVNVIRTNGGDDTVEIASGGLNAGDDLDGGAGEDTFSFENFGGSYRMNLVTDVFSTLTGTTASSVRNFENVIGGAGNDEIIIDGTVNDIETGAGDDTVEIAAAGLNTGDDLDGGTGSDTFSFENFFGSYRVNLVAETFSNLAGGSASTVRNFENVIGGAGDDEIIIDGAVNTVDTGAGDDTVEIASGSLNAGDDLDGGTGDDTFSFENFGGSYRVNLVTELFTTLGGSSASTISNFENVIGGAGNDVIVIDSAVNVVEAGAGNDKVEIAAGNLNAGDDLDGGTGSDTFSFENFGGSYRVNLVAELFTTLGGSSASTISNFENVIGGAGNDYVIIDKAVNTVDTGAGDDTVEIAALSLNAGDDIEGGAGQDTFDFSNFASSYRIDLAAETFSALGGGAESTVSGFENVEGGNGNDLIVIDGEVNVVNAAGGDDTVVIASGALNAGDDLDGGTGSDTFSFENFFSDYNADLNAGTFSSLGGGSASAISNFENITAGQGDDVLRGNGATNVLNGSGGNDTFLAFNFGDTFNGGSGADTFDFSTYNSSYTANLRDNVWQGGGGVEVGVFSALENVEAGNGNDRLIGTNGVNVLDGGRGRDSIYGLGGNDELVGGRGNDRIDGGSGTDTAVYSGNRAEYAITTTGSETVVSHIGGSVIDGVDTLFNVELLAFADQTFIV